MLLFILWIATCSVCIDYAYAERSAKAFIALAVLALVPIIIPDLIGV